MAVDLFIAFNNFDNLFATSERYEDIKQFLLRL